MKERFWPWKRIAQLEQELNTVIQDLRDERIKHIATRDAHKEALALVEAHREAAAKNNQHIRKMASILALKGGIPLK